MKVAEIMTPNVHLASPGESLQKIAKRMAVDDVGFLPVGENDQLVGTITDRDIVVRARRRRQGRQCDGPRRDDQGCQILLRGRRIEHVVQNMGDIQVRRLPVLNRDKRLVGVVSLADAALKEDPATVGIAMSGVVVPGGAHAT